MSKLKIGGVYGDKEFCPQRSISRAASHQLILVSTNCEDDPGSPPPYVHLKDKKTNRSQSFQVKDVKPPAQGASALDGRMRRRSSQGKVPIFLRAQSSDSLLVKKGPREQRQPISRAQSSQNSFRRKEITQTRAPRPASKIRAREVREEAQEEAPAAERHAAPLQRKQQGSFHLLNSQLQALAGERTRSMAHLRDLQKDLEELRKTTGAENAAEVELVDPDEETEQAPPPPRVPKVVCDLRRAVQKSSYLLQQVAKLKMNASTAQAARGRRRSSLLRRFKSLRVVIPSPEKGRRRSVVSGSTGGSTSRRRRASEQGKRFLEEEKSREEAKENEEENGKREQEEEKKGSTPTSKSPQVIRYLPGIGKRLVRAKLFAARALASRNNQEEENKLVLL